MNKARCRSCGAAIIWVVTAIAGKAMPLNYEPTEEGNIILIDGKAVVCKEREPGELMYLSHHATCPYAKWHQKKAKK